MRTPAVAGAFYPGSKEQLKHMLSELFPKKSEEINLKAIIAPHAGYIFSGKTAALTYGKIKKVDTVIVIGPNHSGVGSGLSTSKTDWKTPLGVVKIDKDFVEKIKNIVPVDEASHLREHSIEVQLPFLQHKLGNFEFVPISINPIYFEIDTIKKVAEKIAEVIKVSRKKYLIVASSDFTHHGSVYGYKPFRGSDKEILDKIKNSDMEAIEKIKNFDVSGLLEICDDKSICGYGAIGVALEAAKLLGSKKVELVDYTTSYKVSRDIGTIVAYAGLVIY